MPPEMIESMVEIAGNSASEAFQGALSSGYDVSQSLEVALNEASGVMIEMGAPSEMVDLMATAIKDTYNEAITNGASPREAFDVALDAIDNGFVADQDTSAMEKEEDVTSEYNLDFAHSSNSPAIDLLDEAIAKGLSVEEAIKYVNNKMFPEDSVQQGPPTLANFRELNSNETDLANKTQDFQESNQLNQMEADMDAEAGKILHENTTEDSARQELGGEKTDIEDDDIG